MLNTALYNGWLARLYYVCNYVYTMGPMNLALLYMWQSRVENVHSMKIEFNTGKYASGHCLSAS